MNINFLTLLAVDVKFIVPVSAAAAALLLLIVLLIFTMKAKSKNNSQASTDKPENLSEANGENCEELCDGGEAETQAQEICEAETITDETVIEKKAEETAEEANPQSDEQHEPEVHQIQAESENEPEQNEEVAAEEEKSADEQPAEQANKAEQPVEEVFSDKEDVSTESPAETEKTVEKTAADDDEDDEEEDKPFVKADEDDYDKPVKSAVRENGTIRYIIIKYNKSFTAKLIQSDAEVKNYYSAIKNELLSYTGIKTRMSWKGESFYSGRQTYAKLCIRGKCVCLFLALNPKNYEDTKYKVDDMTEIAAYEKIPCLYRIKNDRRLKFSAELIEAVMQGREKNPDYAETDWAKHYPYEKIEPLIERKLVKVLTEEDARSGDVFKPRDVVTAAEVDELMQDDIAVALIEETDEISDRTKTDIVNIDTLSKNFADGETVTLEEIKKRIPAVSKRATFIKVLARGSLDKKLVVIADSFSIEAAKMILLTGGNAIKKKNS